MEKWLLEEKFLATFAFHVDTGETIPSNLVAQLINQYRKKQTKKLCHQAFLGQLELELHSTFDPHGEESIIGLQRRLAEHYLLPSDDSLPAKSDLSPLLRIFENNASGYSTALYRCVYLLHCIV
jgi:Zn-dependent oligopeptidase